MRKSHQQMMLIKSISRENSISSAGAVMKKRKSYQDKFCEELMEESKIEMDRVPLVEFFIQSAERLQVSPIVKYSAFSFLADRFVPFLPTFIQAAGTSSSSWLLRPVTQSTLQLFALISLWISTKIHNSRPLSIACFKSLADTSIQEQHFTTRNFLEAEVLFMQVLNFEIGTANIAFFFLEDLWVQFKGVAKVGELISIEVCMDIMDLLYEKEEMSVHFRSPKSLAASILVTSYVITVPKQKWEFPVLAWVNFVTSCKEDDITRLVTKILKHVLRPS